ncbi:hypothetical protein EDD11_006342 [Mortierella claussenii]|nr:hypothetical protein EDD11_006342 [Mortierella claussenii]
MSADPDPSPGLKETDKDRTSIRLMDLPMQQKTKKDKSKDHGHRDADSSTTAASSSSSSSSSSSAAASGSGSGSTTTKTSHVNAALSIPKPNPAATQPTRSGNNSSNIESDSDPTFLPSDDGDDIYVSLNKIHPSTPSSKEQAQSIHSQKQQQPPSQQQQQSEQSDAQSPTNPSPASSSRQHRIGNPPHYETREERQNRIRKQFRQLDDKRSGFLDANSLVGFFAEVTPDRDVQRRYADELLQLCHSRSLSRNNNGTEDADEDDESSGDEDGQGGDKLEQDGSDIAEHGHGSNSHTREQRKAQIRYDDFEVFVEEKEERLWNLFREIDHNNDNEIQPEELQASLVKAGINLSDADLQRFIKAMDKDGDGVIDYEEWRDFLVLLPRETTLKEIFHYVQEVVAQVGVDGDVVMPPSENDYVAKYLLAGAIAGAVSRTATAPLDRLKVYLITNSAPVPVPVPALTGPVAQAGLKHIPRFSTPTNAAVAPMKQRLLWNAITELYQQGGIKTFFRGNGLNIVKIAPESAIKFYTYETSKTFIVNHLPSLTIRSHHHPHDTKSGAKPLHPPDIATSGRFLAGGVAGLVSQFSIYPLETIKTRIMSSTGRTHKSQPGGAAALSTSTVTASSSSAASASRSSSSLSTTSSSLSSAATAATSAEQRKPSIRTVAREMWQKAGLRGFYRGLGPSLVGIFPYAAIDLSVFETLKFGYMRWKAGVHEGDEGSEEKALERPSVFVLLACGTISGSVGATSVYPLSLVRTRLQAQGTPHHPQTYTSTLDVFRKTYEKEGIRGFYKGMIPTLTKVVPAVSISYVVYEYSKRELGL